jgi:hypothetical protein
VTQMLGAALGFRVGAVARLGLRLGLGRLRLGPLAWRPWCRIAGTGHPRAASRDSALALVPVRVLASNLCTQRQLVSRLCSRRRHTVHRHSGSPSLTTVDKSSADPSGHERGDPGLYPLHLNLLTASRLPARDVLQRPM